jgi:pimeloyl-ACP methyl ester carboxylesterase
MDEVSKPIATLGATAPLALSRRQAVGMIGAAGALVGCVTALGDDNRSGPIDETVFQDINGAKHFVRIRGDDAGNPAMMYLHGGPGAGAGISAWAYFEALGYEKTFTLIHWDQPGAGRTFEAAGKTIPTGTSEASIAADGCLVAEAMRARLGKRKLVLVGGSWGSAIGLRMALARPDLFHAYVGSAQVVSKAEGEAIVYQRVLAKARARADERAIAELTESGPPPYASPAPFRVQRKWANAYEAPGVNITPQQATARAGMTPDDNTLWLTAFLASDTYFGGGQSDASWSNFDARTLGRDFRLPMFFFQGDEDDCAPAQLVEDYARWIRARRTLYQAIPGGGHNVNLRDRRFIELINQHVRPLATSR